MACNSESSVPELPELIVIVIVIPSSLPPGSTAPPPPQPHLGNVATIISTPDVTARAVGCRPLTHFFRRSANSAHNSNSHPKNDRQGRLQASKTDRLNTECCLAISPVYPSALRTWKRVLPRTSVLKPGSSPSSFHLALHVALTSLLHRVLLGHGIASTRSSGCHCGARGRGDGG